MHTLLLQSSFQLIKSMTRLKNTSRETAYRLSSELKIWHRHEYFFRRQPRWKIRFVSAPNRMHALRLQSSFHLNKSLTRLKNSFRKTIYMQSSSGIQQEKLTANAIIVVPGLVTPVFSQNMVMLGPLRRVGFVRRFLHLPLRYQTICHWLGNWLMQ